MMSAALASMWRRSERPDETCARRRYPTLVARTACVSFNDPKRGTYTHVTAGDTLFESVNRAMNWFADPYWRGPRPGPDTVFGLWATKASASRRAACSNGDPASFAPAPGDWSLGRLPRQEIPYSLVLRTGENSQRIAPRRCSLGVTRLTGCSAYSGDAAGDGNVQLR
jgi:hypothetical protein